MKKEEAGDRNSIKRNGKQEIGTLTEEMGTRK
jgi:hypothetical protein